MSNNNLTKARRKELEKQIKQQQKELQKLELQCIISERQSAIMGALTSIPQINQILANKKYSNQVFRNIFLGLFGSDESANDFAQMCEDELTLQLARNNSRPSKPKANSQDKPKSEVSTVIKSESKNTPPKQEIASNNTSNYPSQTPSTRDTDIRKEFIKTIQASIEKSPIKVMKSNEFLSGGIQDQ